MTGKSRILFPVALILLLVLTTACGVKVPPITIPVITNTTTATTAGATQPTTTQAQTTPPKTTPPPTTTVQPLLVVNQEALKHKMNTAQQADMYQAFYEVVNSRPTGSGQVMGIFSWGYNYIDNYLFTPGKIDGFMAMEKSGNVRGKPAEAVIKFWNFLK